MPDGDDLRPMADPGYLYPSISVIVPTRNRAAQLKDALASVLAQEYPTDRLEVIVVDNRSMDETPQVVQDADRRAPFPVIRLLGEDRGPAAARNLGIAASGGEILAFTDSDCRAEPTWLLNAVKVMAPGVAVVAGPVYGVVNPRRIPGFFAHQVPDDHGRPNALYPTANILYRREVFDRTGGFDERFGAYFWGPPVGGEDTEMAWRAIRAGFQVKWAQDAVVTHEASNMPFTAWLLDPIRIQIMPRLVGHVPELRRRHFWNRIFVDSTLPTFHLAVIGTTIWLVAGQPAAMVLVLPWMWALRLLFTRDVWPPTRWWRIPIKYALMAERYALTALALVYGSIRYRQLVL